MLRFTATNAVISRGFDNRAALKYSEDGNVVRFRIGERVYDNLDRTIRITPVLIPEHPLDAAAVITRSKADPKGSRQLHIFVPPARTQKGHAGYESKRVQTVFKDS